MLALVFATSLGHLWNWVADVFGRIGDVSIYWLVLALALKTAESALIGLSWRNILRAAYPKSDVSFKTAWGASQGGTAINAVAPVQAGTAAKLRKGIDEKKAELDSTLAQEYAYGAEMDAILRAQGMSPWRLGPTSVPPSLERRRA
jgi:hypothetical protein